MCYLPLGDPRVPGDLAAEYVDCGVDVLEIGVPGGDPHLDGPTIAASLTRARAAGTTWRRAADLTGALRERLPCQAMVWMTYLDGAGGELVKAVAASGVDGLLAVGPGQECDFRAELERSGIHLLGLLRHEPSFSELREMAEVGRGYLMLQAVPAQTGVKHDWLPSSAETIRAIRALGVVTPVVLGIGLSTPAHVRAAVEMGADGVVVGSATVEAALEGREALVVLLTSLRQALDAT